MDRLVGGFSALTSRAYGWSADIGADQERSQVVSHPGDAASLESRLSELGFQVGSGGIDALSPQQKADLMNRVFERTNSLSRAYVSPEGQVQVVYHTNPDEVGELGQRVREAGKQFVELPSVDPSANEAFLPGRTDEENLLLSFYRKWFKPDATTMVVDQLVKTYSKQQFKAAFTDLCLSLNDGHIVSALKEYFGTKPAKEWNVDIVSFRPLKRGHEFVETIIGKRLEKFYSGTPLNDVCRESISNELWLECESLRAQYPNNLDMQRYYLATYREAVEQEPLMKTRALRRRAQMENGVIPPDERILEAQALDKRKQGVKKDFLDHLGLGEGRRLIALARIFSELHGKKIPVSDLTIEQCQFTIDEANQQLQSSKNEQALLAELDAERRGKTSRAKNKKPSGVPSSKSAKSGSASHAAASSEADVEDVPTIASPSAVAVELAEMVKEGSEKKDAISLHPRVYRWLSSKSMTEIREAAGYRELDEQGWSKASVDHFFPKLDRLFSSPAIVDTYTFAASFNPGKKKPSIPVQGILATQTIQMTDKKDPVTDFGVLYVATDSKTNRIYHAYFEKLNKKCHTLRPEAEELVEAHQSRGTVPSASDDGFSPVGLSSYTLRDDGDLEVVYVPTFIPNVERISYIFHKVVG